MRVVRRFHYPLPAMPGWFAKYAVVEVAGEQRLEWEGITRKQTPSEGGMQDQAIIALKAAVPGSQVFAVHHLKLTRSAADGRSQEVSVEILDEGYGSGTRFHVTATSDDGKVASGNPQSTIERAVAMVHWGDLG